MPIKVLDCTLRDGGYINEWNFGAKNIKSILNKLVESNIDFIEYGFMSNTTYSPEKTLFSDINQIRNFLSDKLNSKLFSMIKFGEYVLENIPNNDGSSFTDGFRVIFKKKDTDAALQYCRDIQKKGYMLFINLTNFDTYENEELIELVQKINAIKPYALALVDTKGALQRIDVTELFNLIDKNLDESISICFHSHNNLQLSFVNARVLMHMNTKRDIIIDSCVLGMGRGAGNLCTEQLIEYVNGNLNGRYHTDPIKQIIGDHIDAIRKIAPWGYSVPYHLAAAKKCHPNYASYITEMGINENDAINEILKSIPDEKREEYDAELIQELCSAYAA